MINKEHYIKFYDEYRTLVLNKEYYARRVSQSRKILRNLDIFLALFAAGSGVLGFSLWKAEIMGYSVGPIMLALATGIALVLGIARPYLKLEDEHQRLSELQGSYSAIAYAMEEIITRIKTDRTVDEASETVYKTLRQVRGSFQSKEDQPSDRKLIDEMQKVVDERHPQASFYYPP